MQGYKDQAQFLNIFQLLTDIDKLFEINGVSFNFLYVKMGCVTMLFTAFATFPFYELLFQLTIKPFNNVLTRTIMLPYSFLTMYSGIMAAQIIILILCVRVRCLNEELQKFNSVPTLNQYNRFNAFLKIRACINKALRYTNETFGMHIILMYVCTISVLLCTVQSMVFPTKMYDVLMIWGSSFVITLSMFIFLVNFFNNLVNRLLSYPLNNLLTFRKFPARFDLFYCGKSRNL